MTGPLFSGLGEPKPRVSRGYDGNITYNYAILYIYVYLYTLFICRKRGRWIGFAGNICSKIVFSFA